MQDRSLEDLERSKRCLHISNLNQFQSGCIATMRMEAQWGSVWALAGLKTPPDLPQVSDDVKKDICAWFMWIHLWNCMCQGRTPAEIEECPKFFNSQLPAPQVKAPRKTHHDLQLQEVTSDLTSLKKRVAASGKASANQ